MRQLSSPLTHLAPICLTILVLIAGGCGTNSEFPATSTSFAVISDPHLYDGDTLGTAGTDFDAYLAQDRKMLIESREILTAVIDVLKSRKLDFVIVAGDLTKDGELVDHQLMALMLAELETSGKKVYVVPGNHDINNPHALSYKSSPPVSVEKLAPEGFKRIYADFGYQDAIYTDDSSLSYIAEPVKGIWLFALDSCKYADNLANGVPTTSGAFSSATQAWIVDRLKDAKAKGKTVIGMMHHGILEHFKGQSQQFPEYVIDDWSNISKVLSDNGLDIIFTGHFHANDIAHKDFTDSGFYDVETGSLASYPSPYRIVDFDMASKKLAITTEHVTTIPSHPDDFVAYSNDYIQAGLAGITKFQLSRAPYNLTDPTLTSVAGLVVSGMMAHYAGDEAPNAATVDAYSSMIMNPDPATMVLGQSIASLWTDLVPQDNNVTITLDSK